MDLHMQLQFFHAAKLDDDYQIGLFAGILYSILYFCGEMTKFSIDSVSNSFVHVLTRKP